MINWDFIAVVDSKEKNELECEKDLSSEILASSLNIQACFCLHFIQAWDNLCSSE